MLAATLLLGTALAAAPIDEVLVRPPKDTHLAATYPADGSSVASGTLMMKVVFDQPMAQDGWSYTAAADKGQFPKCLARPRLLADQKTFVLLCSLAVNTTYAVQVNATNQFESEAGRRPPPYVFTFKTTDAPTLGLHDALAAAGLSDADDPIMNEQPGGPAMQSTAKFGDQK